MRTFVVLVLVAFVVLAEAQQPDNRQPLLDACSAIQIAEKRASCFEALAKMSFAGQAPAPQRNRFDALQRAFTALQSAIETGLSYVQYGPMVQAAAMEVALISDASPTAPESEVIGLYTEAVDAYKDAAKFWAADIEFYSKRDNRISYAGGLPFDDFGLRWMVNKYSLPTRNSDLFGMFKGVPRSVALSKIWEAARDKTDRARSILTNGDRANKPGAIPQQAQATFQSSRDTVLPVQPPAPKQPPPNLVSIGFGQESHQVERMPEARACNPTPNAVLTAKGAGYETYSLACTSGDVLLVRCEFGNCRIQR